MEVSNYCKGNSLAYEAVTVGHEVIGPIEHAWQHLTFEEESGVGNLTELKKTVGVSSENAEVQRHWIRMYAGEWALAETF